MIYLRQFRGTHIVDDRKGGWLYDTKRAGSFK